jgi:TonB-linked SusC/RagA family outer membrane protein
MNLKPYLVHGRNCHALNKILLVMKLIIILLTTLIFQVSASSFAQKITLNKKNARLNSIIKDIRTQSGYDFIYNLNLIKGANPVSINVQNADLKDVLELCFENQPFTYVLADKAVIVKEKKPGNNIGAIFQWIDISGRVLDEKGGGIPGATIKVKGTSHVVVSDANGRFTLKNIDENTTLLISFVGFVTREVNTGTAKTIDVTLIEQSSSLSDVVVVGYGTVKKADLTTSVSRVNVKEMAMAPVSSFAEALGGRVAGVTAAINDGQPGSGVNIVVRGGSSFSYSNAPLYVIDGFPVESFNPASINPEDIETFTILKDAASTAIYGSRGSNGVIVIQTKRGMVSEPVVTFSTSYGLQVDKKRMEMMSPYEFVKYVNELHPTLAYSLAYLKNRTLDSYKNEPGIDWQDQIFRNGAVLSNNIALRGGTEKTKYSLSGSLFDQKGVILNTGLKRYSGRITIDQTISEKFKAGVTANYSVVKQFGQTVSSSTAGNEVSSFLFFRTWAYRPIASDDFNLLEADADASAVNTSDYRINPVTDLENQYTINNTGTLEANGYLSYDITKDLVLKIAGGARINRDNNDRFYNSKTGQGSPNNPANVAANTGIWGSLSNTLGNMWSNSNTLSYNKTLNKDHNLNAVALFEVTSDDYLRQGYSAKLLPNEGLGIYGLSQGTIVDPARGHDNSTLASYGARVNYSYKSKYLLSASMRRDGSSKFAEPWGNFPAGSLAWNMNKEDFFVNAFPFVSTSKLRASYGTTGNNRMGAYERFAALTQSKDGYPYGNVPPTDAVYISRMENRDLQWEKTEQIDLGYELGLFEDRISLEVDLYKKNTNNMLLGAKLAPSTGFAEATKNIGKLQNKGLEITLNTVNISNPNFRWTSNFNISFNQNKIVELADGATYLSDVATFESQFNGEPLYLHQLNRPVGMMFGYVWEGNYQYSDFDNPSPGIYLLKPAVVSNGSNRQDIKPGDIKYKDLNGDGQVTSADKTIIGRGLPIHTGGFVNDFAYKGFSLNVFFQWSYGANIYNANRLSLEGNSNGRSNMNQFASYVNRWSPENQTNENYRAGGAGPVGRHSSRVVEDGSYLRLKTLAFNYSIPKRLISPLSLKALNINVAAQNLLTFTKYSGLDPEVSVRNQIKTPNFDFSSYPQGRTLVFGINATF